MHNSIDLTAEFEPTAEKVEKIIFCTGSANLILKHGASPNRLITYLCKQVLPKFASLSPSQQLSLLKVCAPPLSSPTFLPDFPTVCCSQSPLPA